MELIKLKGFYLGQPNGGEIDQHSGYVTVDAKAGRALFYYFVESANSSTEPLSLAELGPYPVNTDGKCLSHSKYARNSVKYFIMCSSWSLQQELDFPTRIHHLTMTRTAEDSYTLLVNWFERLPEYRAREFFLAGESYAGHFVPQACSIDPSIQQDFQSNFHQFKRPSCDISVSDTLKDSPLTVLPIIQELMRCGIRVYICSGDSDGRVPTTSKRHSINKLGALVNTTWYPWHSQGEMESFHLKQEARESIKDE
ncbi:hypothetical protein CISIN_1g042137mg [Citrus sinensis]|uniref:Carboxypeptidase n=1 Tax=Citrus sinensis TaxID=2711 RepID=A0A067E216_CITSI|nr:hypothetical protein CISIN_1g042137mg [Citrus sinensis]